MRSFTKFLSLAAFIVPTLLSAGSADCNCPDFRLKDFEGCFAGYGNSAGGIGGPATPVTSASVSQLAQVKWDKNGNGTLGFLSVAIWAPAANPLLGVPTVYSNAVNSSATATNINLATITASLKLTNPNTGLVVSSNSTGTGVIEIKDFPVSGDISAGEFVAFKRDGKVVKYAQSSVYGTLRTNGDVTQLDGPDTGVSLLVVERQGQ